MNKQDLNPLETATDARQVLSAQAHISGDRKSPESDHRGEHSYYILSAKVFTEQVANKYRSLFGSHTNGHLDKLYTRRDVQDYTSKHDNCLKSKLVD